MKKVIKNPFSVNAKISTLKINSTLSVGVEEETDSIELAKSFLVESQKHTKVYHTPYDDKLLFSMSPKTRDIFLYMILNLKKDEDFIALNYKSVNKKISLSKGAYYKGVKELKDNCIIASKSQGVFWINVNFLFNGNRLKYFIKNYPESLEAPTKIFKKSKIA